MTTWTTGKIIQITHWTKHLFTIILHAAINPFIPGQFAKLKLKTTNNKHIQRAYSYVNTPNNINLEFYLVSIPNGKLSPLLYVLRPGDEILISKEAYGTFILETIPNCHTLWMLATGTGIGPYLSILEYGQGLQRFTNIVLVHAVRFVKHLNYLPHMLRLKKKYKKKIKIQTILSQETMPNSLTGRLPYLIKNGLLEQAVGLTLAVNNSHVMLCGNPHMVYDVQELLKKTRGMKNNIKNKIGQITKEKYW
ncbi:ferredoxin--NADP(+) reductase [Blochmannia endosymbiont of Camponotus (Colobopsis) obliquus]|uniref:ferredoxin--NADP(+) reductase n=1 Tax=Blochmannia endosymbiont of Camponotus (Colobopsis) obliquus TaxID=1505597 RepID=UPI00061A604B|nr:ferredoxin--NADP(+) reductase [Blochmannia endosymbiont of Camponotus (Colobopsis) obliquus]AKC60738.1 ferredoxin-NADP reductase [Blochmannia endosymbiont of Camponotus (Colobopsis) obliquus]